MTKFVAIPMKPVKSKDNWPYKKRQKFNKWKKPQKNHIDPNRPKFESSQDNEENVFMQSNSYKGADNYLNKRRQMFDIRGKPHKKHINPTRALHITNDSAKESELSPNNEENASMQSTSCKISDLRSDEAHVKQGYVSSKPELKNEHHKTKGKRGSEQEDDYSPNWKKLKATLEKEGKSRFKKPGKNVVIKKEEKTGSEEVWFDDVDPSLLEEVSSPKTIDPALLRSLSITYQKGESLVVPDSFTGLTKAVGLDCEMVGGGPGKEINILARVSVVNFFGHVLYDKYVKSSEKVTDYRTRISGVRPKDMKSGESFHIVQKEVGQLLKDRIVVGHALENDFNCLLFPHPIRLLRDSASYEPFRQLFNGKTPSLKFLSDKVLGVQIQSGEHSSVVDAQAAMRLYFLNKQKWDKSIYKKLSQPNSMKHPAKKKRPKFKVKKKKKKTFSR